nr:hypothetical protein HK105_002387 [Polyrhizophydium stewartii]
MVSTNKAVTLAKAAVVVLASAGWVCADHCLADVVVGARHQRHLHARDGEWGYDGAEGAAFWASLDPSYVTCAAGQHQSPINFEDPAMLQAPAHRASWPDVARGVQVVNNGHTVQANIAAGAGFTMRPGGVETEYTLAQFHLHAPSEHHVHERSYALEAHFVHATPDKKLAVLGVWFVVSDEPSPFIASMLSRGVPMRKNETVELPQMDFGAIKQALQAPGARFWSYEGSLTTPPCTEGVKWSVLARPLPVSARQLQVLQAAMPFNARSTAPVGKANTAAGAEHGAAAAAMMLSDEGQGSMSLAALSAPGAMAAAAAVAGGSGRAAAASVAASLAGIAASLLVMVM